MTIDPASFATEVIKVLLAMAGWHLAYAFLFRSERDG